MPNVVLRSSPSKERADEWALVLAAEGLSPAVRGGGGTFSLWLPESQVEPALAALAAYERENPPAPANMETETGAGTEAEATLPSRAGTLLALALLLFFFVTGPRQPGNVWFSVGSADAERILSGETWRTVTALTLHADLAHVAANAIMGAILVNAVCGTLGGGLGLAAVLLAGTGGNALNALFQAPPHSSVGASTAVFAALGLLCGPALARRRRRGARGGRLMAPIAAGIGVIAMLGVGGPRTDLWAHLFGFAVGAALGLPWALRTTGRPGRGVQLACGTLAAVVLLGAWALASLPGDTV